MNSTNVSFDAILKGNPYNPNFPKEGKWFFNPDVIRQLKDFLGPPVKYEIIILHGRVGSGKTSTMKHISQVSAEKLGHVYTPIYMDLRKFEESEGDDFILFFYRELIEKLRISGFPLDIPDIILKQMIMGQNLESFAMLFESIFISKRFFILICDEFDDVLENTNRAKIQIFVRYYKFLKMKWRNLRLIIVLNKPFPIINLSQEERQFWEKAGFISIQEFFENEKLRAMITEPVTGFFVYESRAVDEILRLSGGNLYFQQLICYYTYEVVAKKCQIHIAKEDVVEAVKQLLSSQRPDLDEAWEKLLPLNYKLFISALVDKTISDTDGKIYFLEENALLKAILGEQLTGELKKLDDGGYIISIAKAGRFVGYAITIPLFGHWVNKEHPFLKTVLENVSGLLDKLDLENILPEIKDTRRDRLLPFNKDAMSEIIENWLSLKEDILNRKIPSSELKSPSYFLKPLFSIMGIRTETGIMGCVDLSIGSLNIGILTEAHCFIQTHSIIGSNDMAILEDIATSYSQTDQNKLTIFICLDMFPLLEELIKKPYLNMIAITENELKRIMLAELPSRVFREILIGKLSLQKITPYQTTGPTKATFYGRSKLIDLISGSQKKSFAIVGARKIGKSSLLYKLISQPPPNTYYIFMDMQIEIDNYNAFLQILEWEIKRTFGSNVKFNGDLKNIQKVFRELSKGGKRIFMVMDEIDHLIEFDRKKNYKILNTFRSMAQNNLCQFVFAGFKALSPDENSMDSPLYNFCEKIVLTTLDWAAALDLITKPMHSIGIQYANSADCDLILEYTACHPNLLQFFGKHLIKKIESHPQVSNRRTIFRADIEEIFDSEYEDYVIDEVYMFYSDLENINKLIILEFIDQFDDEGFKTMSVEKIKLALKKLSINIPLNKVHQYLRVLLMRLILIDHGKGQYAFALPFFPAMLKKRLDEESKAIFIQEVIDENPNWKSL